MINIVWETPVPSSGSEGIKFRMEPRRTLVISFEYEALDGKMETDELKFYNVIRYQQILLPTLEEEFALYYDRLCEIKNSNTLNSVQEMLDKTRFDIKVKEFRILFDDGPYFDIFCESFAASK